MLLQILFIFVWAFLNWVVLENEPHQSKVLERIREWLEW
jgi:hypothetical protein